MAYDIFENYIKGILENYLEDTEIDDNLYLAELNEAAMSAEDRHDSDILKSIIDKTSERTNAKLTQEEKDILLQKVPIKILTSPGCKIIKSEIGITISYDSDLENE